MRNSGDSNRSVWIYGIHPVSVLLSQTNRQIFQIFLSRERQDQRIQTIEQLAHSKGISLQRLSATEMQRRFPDMSHQGVVASVEAMESLVESDLLTLVQEATSPLLILIFDGITDPHNLGACLRTAEATGVNFVVIPKDKNVGLTPVVSKVACGAAELIPMVRVTNLARAIDILKEAGVWVYGAAGESSRMLYDLDCKNSMAIVMGSEGEGLRRLTRERCDEVFSIPMQGCVESLNVSVATGVILYEILRQRLRM